MYRHAVYDHGVFYTCFMAAHRLTHISHGNYILRGMEYFGTINVSLFV